jgi:hypothetical protein
VDGNNQRPQPKEDSMTPKQEYRAFMAILNRNKATWKRFDIRTDEEAHRFTSRMQNGASLADAQYMMQRDRERID